MSVALPISRSRQRPLWRPHCRPPRLPALLLLNRRIAGRVTSAWQSPFAGSDSHPHIIHSDVLLRRAGGTKLGGRISRRETSALCSVTVGFHLRDFSSFPGGRVAVIGLPVIGPPTALRRPITSSESSWAVAHDIEAVAS